MTDRFEEGDVSWLESAMRAEIGCLHAAITDAEMLRIRQVAGLWSAWLFRDPWLAFGAILLIAVVPFTLVVILPTNKRLLDPGLDPHGQRAAELLTRWGRLHATRSVLSSIAFVLFLVRLTVL